MPTALLRRRMSALAVLPVVTGLVLVPSSRASAAPGDTVRVSVVPGYAESTGGAWLPVLSSGGQHVLFSSDAPDIWRDWNGQPAGAVGGQLYVHWLASGAVDLVTVNTGNRPSEGGLLGQHDMSAMRELTEADGDGQFIGVVAFDSTAADLTNDADSDRCTEDDGADEVQVNCADVFVRDVYDGQTHKISMNPWTGEEADGRSVHPRVSDDGRWVVFASEASNLVPGDTVGSWDVFLKDMQSGSLRRLTNAEPGANAGEPAISADASTVAFWSTAATLDPSAPAGANVFVWSRATNTVQALPLGAGPGTESYSPTLSGDGRLVGFMSYDELLPSDQNPSYDLYLHDRLTRVTSLVNVGPDGARALSADRLEVADEGRHVLFRGGAGLVPGTPTGRSYVYVRDLVTGAIRIANVNDAGELSNTGADTGWRSLSPDGSRAVFWSPADNLVAGDTNGRDDVFLTTLRDWTPPPTPPGSLDAVLDGSGAPLSTAPEATAELPVVATIDPPAGLTGDLTVRSGSSDPAQAPADYGFFGQQLVIEGPAATTADPYVVTFTVDGSLLGGIAPADVQVFRNGVAVADCTGPDAAVPDPCVADRAPAPAGDAVLTVRTSAFSAWDVGRLDYEVAGPLRPVDPLPVVNRRKAGSAVPVSFTLGGDRGLDVLAAGYPRTAPCAGAAEDEAAASPGASGLGYDSGTATYTFVWKTSKVASGCRQLLLRFRDGSQLTARFELR